MRFTRLRLKGFKSFVDPTELIIAEGLTGVVGPNGCGKSNLLEALRWVMGESRAKAMRGAGMEDVIFAGTAKRPARGGASVELTVEDALGRGPGPLAADDRLEIGRRIARDTGSAFTLNGRTVRARDVTTLFADASTGAQSPALVRQGQIGELIAAKPAARRRVLEEAAGIAGLYQRRHEGELKLKATEENLARVAETVDSLDTQLRALARQAAQARRYREIGEALRLAERCLWLSRWQAVEAEMETAEATLSAAMAGVARTEAAAAEARHDAEAAAIAVPPLREEATVANAVLARLRLEEEQLGRDLERAEADKATASARLAQLAQDREREGWLDTEATEALGRLAAEAERLTRAGDGQEDREAALAARAEAARAALAEAERSFDTQAQRTADRAAAAAAADRALEAARAARANATRDRERLTAEVEAQAGALSETQADAAQRAALRAEAAEALKTVAARLAAAESAHAAARAEAGHTDEAKREAESTAKALASEAEALTRMLAADRARDGALIDRIRVAPGYEAALAAALGDDLGFAEVDRGSGWATAPSEMPLMPLPDGTDALAQHVEAPAALAPRLAAVAVLPDGTNGAAVPLAQGQRLVSSAGDLWRWDGFHLAAADAPSPAAIRLERRNRLSAVEADLAAGRSRLEATVAANRVAAERLRAAAGEETAARSAHQAAAKTEAAALRTEAEAASRRESLAARLAVAREKAADCDRAANAAARLLADAEKARADVGDVEAARGAMEDSRTRLAVARSAASEAAGALDSALRDAASRIRRLAAIARDRRSWEERRDAAGDRLAELDRRLGAAEADARRTAEIPPTLTARGERLAADIAVADRRLAEAEAALTEAEMARDAAAHTAADSEAAGATAREARVRADADRCAAERRRRETGDALQGALSLTPDALSASLPDGAPPPTPAEAERQAEALRRQRDAIGPVNLRAEQDAAEIETERDALAAEKADLEAAIERLRGGVRTLNREGRARLVEAFEKVNATFAALFRHLFGGGEARLVLVDSEDPLDAGLEILAQPPGKKLATLSLLSGGEQTLTALSLIFAVFLTNPAPVCVLDEVDAPLDDANVLRFCTLLDEMVRRTETRFLVITHNAITMSRMDRLFGVTMVERGVSRLVSVDLARAEEMVTS